MKNKYLITVLIIVLLILSSCSGSSGSKTKKKTVTTTTTTTLPSLDKENEKLLSVLPALEEMEAGLTENERKIYIVGENVEQEVCPGVTTSSI